MYPVTIGYAGATQRINDLISGGHHAEALVTTAFTVEKTLRRTLRQLVVSAGFISPYAEKIVRSLGGLAAIKDAWETYDPRHRKLTDLVAQADWATLVNTSQMRNKLVHGERVFKLADCQQQATDTLAALNRVKGMLDTEYGYSGWARLKVRKLTRLHQYPAVRWTK
jgi:hypothetical protein